MRRLCCWMILGGALWGVQVWAAPSLNGMAIYHELGEERFIAGLYTETLSRDPRQLLLADEPKVMELRFIDDRIYPRRFKRLWIEGIAINAGPADLERFSAALADFGNMLKVKMRTGDILRIERGERTQVRINGYLLGEIPDREFFDLLLRTWVGPVPLSSEFKEGLLLGGDVPESVRRRFSLLQPTRERVIAVTRALETDKAEISAAAAPAAAVVAAAPKPPAALEPKPQPTPEPTPAPKTEPAVAVAPPPKPTPTAEPKPEPKQAQRPEPTPEPRVAVAPASPPASLPSEDDLFSDSILDDDKSEAPLTAQRLLIEQLYISKIAKWTHQYVEYPRMALKRNQEGVVRVTVTIARNGTVRDVQFRDRSEFEVLNKAARDAVNSASPYPAVPEEISEKEFVFTVPVVFRLR